MIIASCLSVLGCLCVLALLLQRRDWSHGLVYSGCLLAGLALFGDSVRHLFFQPPDVDITAVLPFGVPDVGMHLRLDSLSAFFMSVINGLAALASLYALAYGRHCPEPGRVTPLFPLFLAGMNVVLIADDAFTFLLGWELMSLSSWLLVISDHRRAEVRAAGLTYLVMAVLGSFCLLVAFGLMSAGAADFTFDALRNHALPPLLNAVVVGFVLLGTGSKAGLVPLHIWLPLAHPAAPSHVSALMSGAMTKVAIYGLIRLLFDLHEKIGWGWGAVMMGFGALTAVLGVAHALMQQDIKRLLAYSTIENIGVIFVSLGLAAAFRDHGEKALAALALVAALYHVVNHALFKGLLFFGAGAMMMQTHSRALDQLGGLTRRMPVTGSVMLVGAAAISSLPPLNGFVSEWLMFQALFHAPQVPHWLMRFGVPVIGVLMALAAALAAACFVRFYGIAFLGRARSGLAEDATDPPYSMRLAMGIPALLCLGLGVMPVIVTGAIAKVAEPLTDTTLQEAALGWPWLSPVSATAGSYSATMLLWTGANLLITTFIALRLFGSSAKRKAIAWGCGHPDPVVASQYGGDSFSQPLRRVFGGVLFRARETVRMPPPGDPRPAEFSVALTDPVQNGLYDRLVRGVLALSDKANHLHFLTVRMYLLMMFALLLLLLLLVAGGNG